MARAASLLAERLGDDASRAASLRALGHIYYRKRKYEASLGSLPEVARHLPAAGRRTGGRPHPQQLPAKPDLPGPLPGSHGVRAAGARRSSSGWATGCAWPGWTPTWATSSTARTVSRRRWNCTSAPTSAFLEIGEPQDVAISLKNTATCQISLNDFREALATLPAGARLLRRAPDAACWWRWPTTTSPTSTTCAANTPGPSNSTAPRARTAAPWATPIARRSAISISRRCTWS